MKHVLKTDVNHNGQMYLKGSECPEELVKEFGQIAVLEEIEEPKSESKPAAKPAANAKPEKESK